MDDDLGQCPICEAFLEASELPQHVELHFLEDSAQKQQQPRPGVEPRTSAGADCVACSFGCGAWLRLDELDSHEEAHRLELMEAEYLQLEHQQQAAMEAEEFAKLQAKFGFSDQRPGKCFTCGEGGHWSNTCPKNPRVAAARLDVPLSTSPAELRQQQRQDPAWAGAVDLLPLLVPLLQQQGGPPSTVYLSAGPLYHYSRQYADSGWGCGYRNIQMLAAHLLQRDQAHAAALFGGAGFVPDVASLQAWLEAAWQAGFDQGGAAQFGHSVQGSRKWIGTPEAAALLRLFGVRANVVEFIGHAPVTQASDGTLVHHGVTCDICGITPLTGVRHHSTVKRDFDVCCRCISSPAAQQGGPYIQLTGGQQHSGSSSNSGSNAAPRNTGAVAISSAAAADGRPPSTTAPSSQPSSNKQGSLLAAWGLDSSSSKRAAEGPGPGEVDTGSNGGAADRPLHQQQQAGNSSNGAGPDTGGPSKARRVRGNPGRGNGRGSGAGGAGGGAVGDASKHKALLHWLWTYFSAPEAAATPAPAVGGSSSRIGGTAGPAAAAAGSTVPAASAQQQVLLTSRPPLYLQHDGHSRTLIGIERRAAPAGTAGVGGWEYVLLLLDPGLPTAQLVQALRARQQWQKHIKRGAHTLRKPEYQLLVVAPGLVPPTSPEYQQLKTVAAAERYS